MEQQQLKTNEKKTVKNSEDWPLETDGVSSWDYREPGPAEKCCTREKSPWELFQKETTNTNSYNSLLASSHLLLTPVTPEMPALAGTGSSTAPSGVRSSLSSHSCFLSVGYTFASCPDSTSNVDHFLFFALAGPIFCAGISSEPPKAQRGLHWRPALLAVRFSDSTNSMGRSGMLSAWQPVLVVTLECLIKRNSSMVLRIHWKGERGRLRNVATELCATHSSLGHPQSPPQKFLPLHIISTLLQPPSEKVISTDGLRESKYFPPSVYT